MKIISEKYIKIIYNSSDNLLNILNDILDLSKIEAGMMQVEEVPFNLKQEIEDIKKLYQPIADEKALGEISLEFEGSPDDVIIGDMSKISQVLRNLINNAIKFTDKGGLKIVTKIKDDIFKISVYDTGCGIPEDRLNKIFEKFTQADTSTTRKYGGTGLGLAICKEYLNMMGGVVGVNSKLNFGSEFWFILPLKKADKNLAAINERKVSSNLKKLDINKKILVVDDHPVNRLFAKKLLYKLGFADVDMAEDGIQALEKISKNQYNLVFMDCQMPNLDGYQTTSLIREMEKAKDTHLTIIAMTANAMNGDREKCIRSGMDDYISKPIKSTKLLEVVGKFIELDDMVENNNQASAANNNVVEFKSDAPVDLNHLNMFTDGDKKEERELTSLFFEQSRYILQSLNEAMNYNENEMWKSAAHKLKGASANFGANKLSDICFNAEQTFHANLEEKRELYKKIVSEITAVSQFMKYNPEWLSNNLYQLN